MIEDNLISNGVKNLKEFGYPTVNAENILTDMIFSQLFKSMLEENKGVRKDVDEAIDSILGKINTE